MSLGINQDAQCMSHSHMHARTHMHTDVHTHTTKSPISHKLNIKDQNAPDIPILEEKTQTCFES